MEKIVKDGLRDCTLILNGSECEVRFDTCFRAFAVRNDSGADVFISKSSGIVPDADGVMCVRSGGSAVFAHMDIYADTVYLLGNGRVQVHAQNDSANPFNFAPTIDGGVMAEGNPVIMDNLQGGVPFSEMVVSGKNLLTYPFNESTKTVNGITFTDNGDGTVTANGTATANASITLVRNFGFEKEGNYFLSGCPSGGGLNSFYINWYQNHTGVTTKNYNDYGSGINIPYQHIFSENNSLAISIIAGATVENLVFRPQIEPGDTATTYEPPITGRELTVNVSGKNLIPYPFNRASGTYNGIELIVHDDGRFDMSGTATASFAILVFAGGSNPIYLSGGQTYTISCNTPYDFSKFNLSARIYRADGNYTPIIKFPTTFVAQEGDYLTSTLWIDSDVSVSAKNVELQLEYGDTATAYEPYHGSTITITPTSNPYVIPNDIRQHDGHNVITVSEGELSVVGVRKNAAIKRIWDDVSMDLLFDGLALVASPAEIDLGNYSKYLINCYYNPDTTDNGHCISIVVEYDRLKNIVDKAGMLIHALYTSYALELHFSGTMDNANYYAKVNNNEASPYYTRIYGIK